MNDNIKKVNVNEVAKDPLPVDPSNTSNIGKKVEQGIIDIKEGISEQSGEWEDKAERGIPESEAGKKVEEYIKHPSPEEMNIEEDDIEVTKS